ncbi:MAG: nucleotide-binding universal stress UspA family protein [Alphaproteobacteria bacterium]|jgi:nucleotide-binding universal stress UspA family protein
MLKTILVPIDGSGYANRAVDYAGDLASKFDAKVVLLHAIHYPSEGLPDELHRYAVSEHLDGPGEIDRVVEKILESAAIRANNAGAENVSSQSHRGDPAQLILDVAKTVGADMIVMGSRGLGELKGLLVGSVSDKVLHHAEVPVTIVR